jgi:hypothetical protein
VTDLTAFPVLLSKDLEKTAVFYTGQLGFVAERITQDYLIMRRGQIELHFRPPYYADTFAADGSGPLETQERCYIRGAGIDALFDEFSARDVPGLRPFVNTPWNMFEFYVSDPSGILLVFGRSATEGDAPISLT